MGDEREHRSTVSMPEARRIDTDPPVRIRAEDIPTQQHRWPSGKLRCVDCDAVIQAVCSPSKEQTRPHTSVKQRALGQSFIHT